MEEESWISQLCVNAGLVLAGVAFLFGKDWMAKRVRQGLPAIPPEVTYALSMFGILVLILIFCFLMVMPFVVSIRH
jgi:hypothetical protein